MDALIVGLKWQLLRNGLQRSTPQLVGLIFGGLFGHGDPGAGNRDHVVAFCSGDPCGPGRGGRGSSDLRGPGPVTSTAFSAMSRHRRGREAVSVLVLLLSVGFGLVGSSIMKRLATPGLLAQVADVLGWTPLGLAWSAPADIVDGAIGPGLLRLGVEVIVLAVTLLAWDALLRNALENPRGASGDRASTRDTGLGLGFLLTGFGVASVMSAVQPYPGAGCR